MLKEVLTVTALLWGANLSVAQADERIEHYQALPAESLEQAMTNLKSHSRELENLIASGDLSEQDMVKIHELTYTLENALQRLLAEMNDTAEVLEEVHLGSETMNRQRVLDNAQRYLQSVNTLLQ